MMVQLGTKCFLLGQPIHIGAGGAIYHDPTDPLRLLKVPNHIEPMLSRRLAHLISNPPIHPSWPYAKTAWPIELLFDTAAPPSVVGFSMRDLTQLCALPLAVFTIPQNCPFALPPGFQLHLAHNFAANIKALHASGYLRGDIHLMNDLVTSDGKVLPIDLDSVQVKLNTGECLRCPVGVYEFQPPELQGLRFDQIDRTAQMDAWSLATVIFHLLRDGEHPFSSHYIGNGTKPDLTESIQRGYFAYSFRHSDFQPPRGSKPFSDLPHSLQDLFLRTFELGHSDPGRRPDIDQWVTVLAGLCQPLKPVPQQAWMKLAATFGVSTRNTTAPTGLKWSRQAKARALAASVVLGVGGYVAWQNPTAPRHSTGEVKVATYDDGSQEPFANRFKAYAERESASPSLRLVLSRDLKPRGAPSTPVLWQALQE